MNTFLLAQGMPKQRACQDDPVSPFSLLQKAMYKAGAPKHLLRSDQLWPP